MLGVVEVVLPWWKFSPSKFCFKRLLRHYARERALESRRYSQALLSQVGLFEELAAEDPASFKEVLLSLKERLNSLAVSKARGAQVRSRAFYLRTKERPCSYFLRRESAALQVKYISELCDDSGQVFQDPHSLQRVCKDFYADLLSEHPVDDNVIRDFLGSVPSLGNNFQLVCEGLLTYEECLKAVRQMKGNKSPGLDGLPAKFYKKLCYLFGRDFVNMINDCFE